MDTVRILYGYYSDTNPAVKISAQSAITYERNTIDIRYIYVTYTLHTRYIIDILSRPLRRNIGTPLSLYFCFFVTCAVRQRGVCLLPLSASVYCVQILFEHGYEPSVKAVAFSFFADCQSAKKSSPPCISPFSAVLLSPWCFLPVTGGRDMLPFIAPRSERYVHNNTALVERSLRHLAIFATFRNRS